MIRLHPTKRLLCAEVMPWTTHTDRAHLIERQRFVIDFDAAHAAQRLSDKIIAQDKRLVTEAQK